MENKFDIYQKVKIIGPTTCRGDLHKGEEFEIIYIRSNCERKLEYSGINLPWYPASSLRLVPKFQKGDLVEIIGPSPDGTTREIGEKFVIEQTYEDFSWMEEDYKDCYSAPGKHLYKASSLRLVEDLKVGDWIEITKPGIPDYTGKIERIIRIDELDHYNYPNQIEDKSWWSSKSLRKLTPDEIAKHLAPPINTPQNQFNEKTEERLSAIEKRLTRVQNIIAKMENGLDDDYKRLAAIEKHLKQIDERIEKSPIGCHEDLHKQIEAQFATLKEQQFETCHRDPKKRCALKNIVNRMDCAIREAKLLDSVRGSDEINGRGLGFTR